MNKAKAMDYKDTLVGRLRGPHVNPMMRVFGGAIGEIERLQALCREAADEIEKLTKSALPRD